MAGSCLKAISQLAWSVSALRAAARGRDLRDGEEPRVHKRATFNLGVGMVLITQADRVPEAAAGASAAGCAAWTIGHVVSGERVLRSALDTGSPGCP